MEQFESKESPERITLSIDGTRVVFEQKPSEQGIVLEIVEGLTREIDEPGNEELHVISDNVTALSPEGDMEQSGLGIEIAERDGVTLDLKEGFITGPDIETVRRVLDEVELAYVNPYDV